MISVSNQSHIFFFFFLNLVVIWECNHPHFEMKHCSCKTSKADPSEKIDGAKQGMQMFFNKARRCLVHLAIYLGPPSTRTSDRRGQDLSPHLGQTAWTPSRRLSSWWRTGKTCRSAAPEETATAGWGRCLQNRWGGEGVHLNKAFYTEKTHWCWCRRCMACGFNLISVSSGQARLKLRSIISPFQCKSLKKWGT